MPDMPKPISTTAHSRPRPRYDLVFIFLIGFTALEVATSYLQSSLRLPVLIALAIVKVSLVVLYFMHLKFEFTPLFPSVHPGPGAGLADNIDFDAGDAGIMRGGRLLNRISPDL